MCPGVHFYSAIHKTMGYSAGGLNGPHSQLMDIFPLHMNGTSRSQEAVKPEIL